VSHVTSEQPASGLADHSLFEGVALRDVAELDDRIPAVTFRKGELIYSPYDRGEALYLVERGRVRLYRSAGDGRQLTLAIIDEGESFGRIVVFDEPGHDAYAAAMADTLVRVVRPADLERAFAEHPRVALNLVRELFARLRDAEDQLESLAFRGVSARLAAKLLDLTDRYGRVTPHGIRIDERFTHMQLAEMIGTSRETLTKVLNELRDAGLVDVRDRMIWVLEMDGLERLKSSS
jgi:CRP/FNR family transcriptional regulator, cyclic AMP receptor protein